jgi:hypothetical protein
LLKIFLALLFVANIFRKLGLIPTNQVGSWQRPPVWRDDKCVTTKQQLAFATVLVDTVEFAHKALFTSEMFTRLPSLREAEIQIEKLERMVNKFRNNFTIEVILSLPEGRANKIVGAETHRVDQQSKAVDRVCTKVCEKKVRELISEPGAKLPKSFVKMKTQKLIESQICCATGLPMMLWCVRSMRPNNIFWP